MIIISNKPCQCLSTDYQADDTIGTNSPPANVSTSDSHQNVDIKFIARDAFLE